MQVPYGVHVFSYSIFLSPSQLLSFPDRSASAGDRTFRIASSEAAAVQCNGLLSYPVSVGENSQLTAPLAEAVSNHSLRIHLAHCHVDVDLSLSDRVHRITDAIAAASEAVTKFLPLNFPNSANGMPWWRDGEKREPASTRHVAFAKFSRGLEDGISFQPSRQSHHVGASSLKQPSSLLEPTVSKPAICTTCAHPDLAGSLDLNLICVGLEVILRFPIPLEAVQLAAPQNHSDLRTKLWSTGIPLWIDRPGSISGTPDLLLSNPEVSASTRVGLAWWRRTLRPEYLRVMSTKLTFSYRTPRIAVTIANDSSNKPNAPHAMRRTVEGEILDVRSGVYSDHRTADPNDVGQDVKASEPQLKVTLRLLTVYVASDSSKLQSSPFLQLTSQNTSSDLITVSVRLAPLGRQELVEQQPDVATKLDDLGETPPVFSFSHERFQMGIDLASLDNPAKHVGPSASFGGQPSGRPVEWSLWRRTGPKQNPRTPFVIRRSFLQDAPKAHAKQTTYYPGDVNHMAFYRRSASMNTRYAVLCQISTAVIHVDNKQTMDVVYLRLMYDLLLWTSLLPNDRRLRATLTRPRFASPSRPESDHRYWFLSDPAPLSFIYAHPECAKQAAALEASSVHGATARPHGGLHFLPLGDSEDEGDDFQDGQPQSDVDEDEFDAGLDSVRSRVLNDHRQSVPDLRFSYPPELQTCPGRKSSHGYNKAAHFGQRPSRKKLQTGPSVPHRSDDEDDDENGAYSTASMDTTVQKQSSFCVQLDFDSVEMHVALPSPISVRISQDSAVLLKASAVTVFLEASHDGAPNVNYATAELGTFEVHFTANPHTKPTGPHPSCPQEDTASSHWWPGLVHFSWTGAGYPLSRSQFSDADSSIPTNGPMLTFAVRHCHIEQSNTTTKAPVYRDEFNCTLRLQDTCLVHWPDLEHAVCTVDTDSGLPNWLSHLLHVLQTPSVSVISQLLPGYELPDTLLIQHIHLERIALTWSLSEDHAFPVPVRHVPKLTSQIKSIRAIVGCESVSITVNTASETGSAGASTSTSTPGMLLIAFLSNASVFLCPLYTKTTLPLLEHFTSQSTQFISWLNSLCLTDCVCVADLDHLEMRCFSDPIRTTQTVSTPNLRLMLVFVSLS
ncbi:hypothetical protein P879_08441 [Paragonimus westermani]|uniref:Autophagy-related protein 2 n=1 Tax=Paragonimus westermani TaxID=34504 RepID=A0A8T0DAZ5_9TREM|nr:hypothetical protein P879_08441 [Paragonimus westermani]